MRASILDDDGDATEYSDTVQITVTFDRLCVLTQQYSSSAKVAADLCDLLDRARQATRPRHRQKRLDDYSKKFDNQAGQAFTQEEAATLIRLAEKLAATG